MPPKKAPQPVKQVLLGRVGSNLQVGIVGLPNVGKSTFFNVITKSAIPAENFPFCTIDPNTARCIVPDDRFEWLNDHWKPASSVPAHLNITDIAGLVKGANEGQGLGNAFLSNIKAVDAIFHMCRVFEDDDITHVEGSIDPIRDIEIITEELRLKDIQFLEKAWAVIEKVAKSQKDKKAEAECTEKALKMLRDEKKDIRHGEWKATEIEILNTFQLLSAKPVVYLVNMSVKDFVRKKNKWLMKIKEYADARGEPIIPFSAEIEKRLGEMSEEEAKTYCKDNEVQSVLPKICKVGYETLDLIHYFTAGKDEVKCWTIKKGTMAPAAGGKIHSDFEVGFICAEVMAFNDYKENGSEAECKAKGKYKQQGKNYVVEDGDIIFFKANRGGGGAKKK
ncbi:Obg-like ATPase [Acrasis kona]|uniref:Obg-like ATPase 1 n=1 Tax=Acrasis kona TaxID=1008807 RepID=A0AAW2Z9X8_9EUKA